MPYATRNRTLLCKVEATSGTDPVPVVGTDAFLCEDPSPSQNLERVQTREVTGSLDPRADIMGGGDSAFSCKVYLKGHGTAGSAPEWGSLMRGCGLAQTLTAAAVTGTATAGAASTITLAATASTTVDFYKGMVITLTGGVGSGQTRVIHGYTAGRVASVTPNWTTNPDATSVYSIYANALYIPRSTGLETVTIYDYQHEMNAAVNSKLRKMIGSAGNVSFDVQAGQPVTANFNFTGKFTAPTDVAKPSAATYNSTRPVSFLSAQCYLDSTAVPISGCSFDFGNQTAADDNPADAFGRDVGSILERRISGSLNPPMALTSVRDTIADFIAGTTRRYWMQWGSVAGNRISILFPQIMYNGSEVADNRGFAHENIPFTAQGEDSGVYICVY